MPKRGGGRTTPVAPLSLTASLNPTLLATNTLMLLLAHPAKLMLGYLPVAVTISVTLGLVIVLALNGSSTIKTTRHVVSPAADLALAASPLSSPEFSTPAATSASPRAPANAGRKSESTAARRDGSES